MSPAGSPSAPEQTTTNCSDAHREIGATVLSRFMAAAVMFLVVSMSWHSLSSARIDTLDSAHHLLDGMFIHDVIQDRALSHIRPYTVHYFRQYPALGFNLYPPVFPLVEGMAFLLTGTLDIRCARACVLGFGVLLALLFFAELRRNLGEWPALLGAGLLLTTPVVALLHNQLMLEVPALALGMSTIVAYQRLMRNAHSSWRAVLPVVVAATAAAYTKQTIGILFVALFIDFLTNHRDLIRSRKVWTAAAMIVCLLLPLVALTLTIGRLNIIQSVGTREAAAARGIYGMDRWTLASWLFYPSLLFRMSPLLAAGGAIAAVMSWRDRVFLKSNALWIAWIVVWYVMFSYFIIKQPRFMVLWIPPWVALTMAVTIGLVRAGRNRRWLYCVPMLAIAVNAPSAYTAVEPGFAGMSRVIAELCAEGKPGNIAYFGVYHQVFVPFVRELDTTRQMYLLRGPRIVGVSSSVADALTRFRVRYVLVDEGADAAHITMIEQLRESGGLAALRDTWFTAGGRTRHLRILVNDRPLPREMPEVPLGSVGEAAIAAWPIANR